MARPRAELPQSCDASAEHGVEQLLRGEKAVDAAGARRRQRHSSPCVAAP